VITAEKNARETHLLRLTGAFIGHHIAEQWLVQDRPGKLAADSLRRL
jgi:flagellar biosynthesis/type III secretory pathway ATPase